MRQIAITTITLLHLFLSPAFGGDTLPSRTFVFNYSVTLTGLAAGQNLRLWIPVPSTGECQEVEVIGREVPASSRINRESQFGNQMLYSAMAIDSNDDIHIKLTYRVKRTEWQGRKPAQDLTNISKHLQPNATVPIDGRPLELLKGVTLPVETKSKARVLYDLVNSHMKYDKTGTGWGRGDAVWACENARGNCTDFHSLFLALARSQGIPSKFEIGFPIDEKRGRGVITGYHCWALFSPDGRQWLPVDISEANKNPSMRDFYFGNLTENRVVFSVGRDLNLVPQQTGPPLNFFIYPHAEVDGKPHPSESVQLSFSYEDV